MDYTHSLALELALEVVERHVVCEVPLELQVAGGSWEIVCTGYIQLQMESSKQLKKLHKHIVFNLEKKVGI
ncbi:unnamed protein product, partial [Iphiclides podalirius]